MSILRRPTAADERLLASIEAARRELERDAQFAYRQAAHHLRSPIAVVDTYIELFENGQVDENAIQYVLPVVRRELMEVEKALNDLQAKASSLMDDR